MSWGDNLPYVLTRYGQVPVPRYTLAAVLTAFAIGALFGLGISELWNP